MRTRAILALICAALAAPLAHAADPVRTEHVKFAPGATSATLKGQVKGYGSVDYIVQARAGQTLNVSLVTKNPSSYFNIWEPGVDTAAAAGGVGYVGPVTKTGPHRIQVYLMRNAARRGEAAGYTLVVTVKD